MSLKTGDLVIYSYEMGEDPMNGAQGVVLSIKSGINSNLITVLWDDGTTSTVSENNLRLNTYRAA